MMVVLIERSTVAVVDRYSVTSTVDGITVVIRDVSVVLEEYKHCWLENVLARILTSKWWIQLSS